MDFYSLVIPLGIISYILIVLAILTGKRIIKLPHVWHRIIAWATIIIASFHAAIVIAYNL